MLVISCRSSTLAASLQPCRASKQPSLLTRYSHGLSRCARIRSRAAPESTDASVQLPVSAAAPVTDEAVPEGHQGLHNFLYASGESEHAASQRYEFRQGEDDGSSIVPVAAYLESRDGERPLGVYALYDERHNLQYVGYSRNMVLAVKGQLACVGESRCAFIRPMVFANKAMATRTHMERQVQDWLGEAGVVPPGNGVEAHLWEGEEQGQSEAELIAKMSPTERAAYETKRLKLRKAMGESLHDDVDIDQTAAERRLALLAAVKGDNWSAVVSDQTQATLTAAVAAGGGRLGSTTLSADAAAPHPTHVAGRHAAAAAMAAAAGGSSGSSVAAAAGGSPGAVSSSSSGDGGSGPVVSPFSKASVHRQVGEQHSSSAVPKAAAPPLTIESVTEALEEVRPYLLADGGDVTVVDVNVDSGLVMVAMQGACSSCTSSSATLKMGIERQLKAVFGDAVSEVMQIDTGGGRPTGTVENVDMHLNMLRSAVANLGGAVEVASAGGGVVVLHYRGPAAIGKGLSAAVKDQFPDVKEVVLKDFPAEAA